MNLDVSLSLDLFGTTNRSVVLYKVFIEGTELSHSLPLRSIHVSKSFNKIASAKIFFQDGDPAERDFTLSNQDQFKPGNTIKIQLGGTTGQDTVFEGIIVRHTIKARQNQPSYLMIEAKDKAIKMTLSRKNAYFLDKNEKEILQDIAQPYNLPIDFPLTFNPVPTPPIPPMVQYEATDWDFMVSRAEANSLWVFTDDNCLKIKQPSLTDAPVLVASYGVNILEFEGEMDARRQAKSFKANTWDYAHQEVDSSSEGSFSFSGDNGNLSADDIAEPFEAEVKLNHSGNLSGDEIQQWANAYEMKNKLSKAIGRVKIEGNANVKPGSIITLAGVGDRFNGNVYVTGVLHQYEGSWQTDIQFGWAEDWFYKKENVMEKPASGLLPGVNGLQIGKVLEVEASTTSGNQYRVKVRCPLISTEQEGIWARVATLSAGENNGVVFRPQEGDEVILGFLNDDPRQAIILGYLHSSQRQPDVLIDKKYGIVTKEGLKIIFDDEQKSIQIITPQRSLKIDDTAGEIEMKDAINSIKMDSTGITIHSNTKITIDCTAGVYIN
jgi:Rhs element Vgr protein